MRIELPVVTPIADAYAQIGMEFSIFQTDEKYYPWIINNHVQIYALKDLYLQPIRSGTLSFMYNIYGDWQMFEFSANPYLEYEKVSFDMFRKNLVQVGIVNLIRSYLDDKKYVYLPVDQYEVPVYGLYKKKHIIHHVFISGYDDVKKTFTVWDNLFNGKYQLANVGYIDISNGFNSLVENEEYSYWSESGGISAFRFYQKPWHEDKKELYSINIEFIKSAINEYLLTPGYGEHYRRVSHYLYGIDCYKELEKWLQHGVNSGQCYVDIRAFYPMRDHKKVMIFRLEYLQKYLDIDLSQHLKRYIDIDKNIILIINKIIKSNISKNTIGFEQSLRLLKQVKQIEIETIVLLLKDL